MKNRLICIILAAAIIMSAFPMCGAAAEQLVFSADFEYTPEGEFITVSGTTPARYEQAITIVMYDPQFVNGVEDIREDSGELSQNPAEKKPLASVSDILRIKEIRAAQDGTFSERFSLSGISDGQYIIIKVSGSGKTNVSASLLKQYQTDDNLTNVTLPAFERASANELEDLFRQNQLLLDIRLDADYTENKDKIHTMFVSVREYDCKTDPSTGRKFNSIGDVKKVFSIIDALRTMPQSVTAGDVRSFIEAYNTLIDYDFTSANEHYTLVKNEAYPIAAKILTQSAAKTMSDVKTAISQAVAIALLNTKDNTTVAPVIEEYAVLLGLDKTDYNLYCEKYTAYEVNKAFVQRNFTMPSEITAALTARITELSKTPPNKNDVASEVNSGIVSGNIKKVLGISDAAITSDKDKDIANGTYYCDITNAHWAYEAIKALTTKKIVSGNPDGTYKPEESVTREQFVKMIVLAFEIPLNAKNSKFTDIASDRWSAVFINTAVERGIVMGMPDGSFMAEQPVTRQDAAVMLLRACKNAGMAFNEKKQPADFGEISPYALESVELLTAAGIISGYEDGSFKPIQSMTRAQAAQLIYGIIKE